MLQLCSGVQICGEDNRNIQRKPHTSDIVINFLRDRRGRDRMEVHLQLHNYATSDYHH
jgi:hypothetical protein